jgi:hypothetical protein
MNEFVRNKFVRNSQLEIIIVSLSSHGPRHEVISTHYLWRGVVDGADSRHEPLSRLEEAA